jgi:hypothetical protein
MNSKHLRKACGTYLKGGNCIVVCFCLHLSFAVDQSLKQLRELGNVQIHFGNAHGLCKQYTS